MSTTDGDAASRLDEAIADVLQQGGLAGQRGGAIPAPTTDRDWNVDEPDDEPDDELDEPYRLPDIVPATPIGATVESPERVRAQPTPTMPPRDLAPVPPTVRPATPPLTPATAATGVAPTAPATSWSDHMAPIRAGQPTGALRAPGRRPRVRRVTRVVRHIDPWSTFKLALLFSVVAYVVTLTAGVLLWRVADSTGTLDNVERWFTQFGWETFEFDGSEIFHNAWIMGLFGAVAMTGGLVLLATLFNLVSDIVGGIRVTVLEEEVVERTVSSTRRYVVRRPPVGPESAPAWDIDGGDPDEVTDATDAADVAPSAEWTVDDGAPDDAASPADGRSSG